ncbi:hypothetical protein [Moheibacter sediminis]|uniref:Lipoprotein n=1 Tax=Moheibacter sediminis TaxID=1434700 RepID=A0A1W1ZXH7_9FLAO|nr:hypothetical protein [Moheibacter sediminis]SMC53104.1 hypothetical protein SAMN06296427_103310 [Moheibacter sediminis]
MKKNLLLLLLFISICSCTENTREIRDPQMLNQEDSLRASLNIQIMNFTEIDSSGILIFPLQMGQNKNRRNEYDYKEMSYSNYWNIIFYNSKTSEYHLLTEEKVIINQFDYQYDERSGTGLDKYMFYEVTKKDFNEDKLLTGKDPVYLFVSDKEGKNFRQISPSDTSLDKWKYIKSSGKIIMNVTKDSNKNLLFDDKDEVSTFELVLELNEVPVEIFSDSLKDKLRMLYNRDWKRIK